MNERIQELAREAGFYANPDVEKFEKFAQLIVEECLNMCKTGVGNADYNTGRLHCLENIKQHFGVK